MELLEIKQKERVSREEAARRLHELADSLARHNEVEFERGGVQFKLRVADEVDLELELEVEDTGTQLEIELSW
jgi:amphi-Trp domain-containing protein